jgi:hypothetical protein
MLTRLLNIVYIIYCFEVGIFLVLLPWFHVWENNALIHRYPLLKAITMSGYIRGAVTGLGLANILLGIKELLSIRQRRHDEYFRR